MILHLKQMDQLWHMSTLFNNIVEIEVRVLNELLDCFLICKNTVLVIIFKNSKVWLAWHKKTFFDYMH